MPDETQKNTITEQLTGTIKILDELFIGFYHLETSNEKKIVIGQQILDLCSQEIFPKFSIDYNFVEVQEAKNKAKRIISQMPLLDHELKSIYTIRIISVLSEPIAALRKELWDYELISLKEFKKIMPEVDGVAYRGLSQEEEPPLLWTERGAITKELEKLETKIKEGEK